MWTKIVDVVGREILDSRGNPTVEAEVHLEDGTIGLGDTPSGASTGIYEALELRDGDKSRYGGKGVTKAVAYVNNEIRELLIGEDASDIYEIERKMIALDGTEDKSRFGANAILAVSLACARAAAASLDIPLFRFFGGINGRTLPVPMMNILNGGEHASNTVDVQEFMIMPVGAPTFREALRWCAEVYHQLGKDLKKDGYSASVGDEGGYAPDLKDEFQVLDYIVAAVKNSGYEPGTDFVIAIDAAASGWKTENNKLHADIISDLDSIIKARDYEKLLNACNLKGEISRGLADKYLDKDYINKAIEHIATDRELQEKLINNYFKELA